MVGRPEYGSVFPCFQCTFEANNEGAFTSHMNTTHNLKYYWCKWCGKATSEFNEHLVHLRDNLCTEPIQYPCGGEGCVFSHSQPNNFFEHLKNSHRGTVLYPCAYCKRLFSVPPLLLLHIQNDCCNRPTSSSSSVSSHPILTNGCSANNETVSSSTSKVKSSNRNCKVNNEKKNVDNYRVFRSSLTSMSRSDSDSEDPSWNPTGLIPPYSKATDSDSMSITSTSSISKKGKRGHKIKLYESTSLKESMVGKNKEAKPQHTFITSWADWFDKLRRLKSEDAMDKFLQPEYIKNFFRCMYKSCDFSTDVRTEFIVHLSKVHLTTSDLGTSYHRCCFCFCKFPNGLILVHHMLTEHSGRKYQCSSCLFRAVNTFHVNLHQKTVHAGEDVQVLACDPQETDETHTLTKQDIFNEVRKSYNCKILGCHFTTPMTQQFREHFTENHPDVNNFSCCYCKFETVKFEQLANHFRRHNIHDFECTRCSFGSDDRNSIFTHMCINHSDVSKKDLRILHRLPDESLQTKYKTITLNTHTPSSTVPKDSNLLFINAQSSECPYDNLIQSCIDWSHPEKLRNSNDHNDTSEDVSRKSSSGKSSDDSSNPQSSLNSTSGSNVREESLCISDVNNLVHTTCSSSDQTSMCKTNCDPEQLTFDSFHAKFCRNKDNSELDSLPDLSSADVDIEIDAAFRHAGNSVDKSSNSDSFETVPECDSLISESLSVCNEETTKDSLFSKTIGISVNLQLSKSEDDSLNSGHPRPYDKKVEGTIQNNSFANNISIDSELFHSDNESRDSSLPLARYAGMSNPKRKCLRSTSKRSAVATLKSNPKRKAGCEDIDKSSTDSETILNENKIIKSCASCDKSYGSDRGLAEHAKKVHGLIERYQCSLCNFSSRLRTPTFCHAEHLHKEKIYNIIDLALKSPIKQICNEFLCVFCNTKYNSRNQMIQHLYTELESDSQTCKNCNFKFLNRVIMAEHCESKNHELPETIPYSVMNQWILDYVSSQEGNSKNVLTPVEVLGHVEENQCIMCMEQFESYDRLSEHIYRHMQYKPHQCTECSKSFFALSDAKDHFNAEHNSNMQLEKLAFTVYQRINVIERWVVQKLVVQVASIGNEELNNDIVESGESVPDIKSSNKNNIVSKVPNLKFRPKRFPVLDDEIETDEEISKLINVNFSNIKNPSINLFKMSDEKSDSDETEKCYSSDECSGLTRHINCHSSSNSESDINMNNLEFEVDDKIIPTCLKLGETQECSNSLTAKLEDIAVPMFNNLNNGLKKTPHIKVTARKSCRSSTARKTIDEIHGRNFKHTARKTIHVRSNFQQVNNIQLLGNTNCRQVLKRTARKSVSKPITKIPCDTQNSKEEQKRRDINLNNVYLYVRHIDGTNTVKMSYENLKDLAHLEPRVVLKNIKFEIFRKCF